MRIKMWITKTFPKNAETKDCFMKKIHNTSTCFWQHFARPKYEKVSASKNKTTEWLPTIMSKLRSLL